MRQSIQRSIGINRRGIKPFNPSKQELLEICDKDISQATILAVLEYFIDVQVTQFMRDNEIDDVDLVEEIHFCVLMSYADLEKRGIKRRRFSLAVSKLIERGFIDRFIEPSKPYGPYYYTLNYETIDKAIVTAIKKSKLSASDWAPTKSHNHGEKVFLLANDLPTGLTQGPRERENLQSMDPSAELCTNEHKGILKHVRFNTELCNLEHGDVHNYIDLCTFGHSKTAEIDAKEGVVSGTKRVSLLGAQHNVIQQDTEKPTVSILTQLLMHESAIIFPGIIYNSIIYNGEINNTDNNNKSNPPSHYHSQPKASPSAENDSAHHPQPSASDDESVAVQRTEPEKTTEGENDNTIPIYSPTSYLLSSSLNESTETEDLNTQTDIEEKTSGSPSRPVPAENPENLPSPPLPVAAETLGNELSGNSKEEEQGGGRESIGFCIEGIVGAAPEPELEPEPQEEVDAQPADETSWLGAKVSAYPGAQPMRDTLGYYSGDPDVEDSEIRKQKGKGRRPDEPVKRRRRAFRSTKAVLSSADDWMAVIEERFMLGEYPKSVDHETVALAEYWIRALYQAEPRTAPSLDGMDGWPKIFAGLLSKYKKTPAQFRAISDYIRSTAGSAQWDWSRYVLSPEMLTRRTRNNNMLYIDYFLDIIERESKAVAVVGSSARFVPQQQQAQTTFRYEGMALYEKKEDLSRRMRADRPAGYSLYLSICRAHSGVESFQGLKELFPEDMWHFVEEYMEITGWNPEAPSDNKD